MDKDLLYRYFNGQVTPEELHQVRQWQEESEENEKLLRRERKLFNAMILVGSPEREEDEQVTERVHEARSFSWKSLGRIAAGIVLVLGLAGILFFANRNTANQLAFQTIHVPSGQRVDIVLPDSTHVWLNANTTMTYPLAFMEDRREVIIDGEAYFEVKHNAKCPFTVHTAQMDVTDLGTKFNVEAYSDKGYTETSLMEGKVEIGVGGKQTYVLEPGQKLWVMGGQIKRSTIDDPDTYRWREGLYCFNNKPVSSIMKDFEKYYGIRIQIRKKSIRNVVLSGKFRIAEGLDYALSVMQAEVPFQYHRNEEDSTLYIE